MGSCAAPSAKGDDKFITTDYLQQCQHRQIKYRNNVIECDHGKLKRIIGATLGFKSMKTAYATIKGIEVMRALRKGQASAFYYGDPLGEMRLVSRVFEM
ncbi:DDE-type integrase/transposase/recombinase [Klebsiella pneumoniae]|nr:MULTISPECIES: transposase [Klebsiella]MDG5836861.1 DDE-type integrase/transposase/recombinase [Klebsiella pneumoniae]MDG5836868.1 DDE-type integrase/transposase/recombinase [Klebsiella pneumoniae]